MPRRSAGCREFIAERRCLIPASERRGQRAPFRGIEQVSIQAFIDLWSVQLRISDMAYQDSRGQQFAVHPLGIAPVTSLSGVSATSATPVVLDGLASRQVATMIVTTSAGVSAGSV